MSMDGMVSKDMLLLQEHLILKQPYYVLHPCQTAAVMTLLMAKGGPGASDFASSRGEMGRADHGKVSGEESGEVGAESEAPDAVARESAEYLKAWFSVYGPAVGLKLPPSLWP